MVKFKITNIEESSELLTVYQKLEAKYSPRFRKSLGELKMYTTTGDFDIIINEKFFDYINADEGPEYTSVYFVFDSRVPFHVLQLESGKLIVVDEYFEADGFQDPAEEVTEFDNADEVLAFIEDTYHPFIDKQFTILDKYYHNK